MTPITGNTYPVRSQLKALGGKWDASSKTWFVPDDKAAEARNLVISAPSSYRPNTCVACGVRGSRYAPIYRSGECRDCYEERKMGY